MHRWTHQFMICLYPECLTDLNVHLHTHMLLRSGRVLNRHIGTQRFMVMTVTGKSWMRRYIWYICTSQVIHFSFATTDNRCDFQPYKTAESHDSSLKTSLSCFLFFLKGRRLETLGLSEWQANWSGTESSLKGSMAPEACCDWLEQDRWDDWFWTSSSPSAICVAIGSIHVHDSKGKHLNKKLYLIFFYLTSD